MWENRPLDIICNFLGEKYIHKVLRRTHVTCSAPQAQNDEMILDWNVELVSNLEAPIQQATKVQNKNIRKFMDGIYMSEIGMV